MTIKNFIKLSLYVGSTFIVFINLVTFLFTASALMIWMCLVGIAGAIVWVVFGSSRIHKIGSEVYKDMKS